MIPTLRATVPGVWIGLIVALSFIETPLKFLAPDVTVPLALGIGRLVLTAANIAGAVLLIAITVLSVVRPRVRRSALVVVAAIWVTFLVQVTVIRPPLNARTDIVLAGGDPGPSSLHLVYVVADVVILALLIAYLPLARAATAVPAAVPAPPSAHSSR
jgi:hypothetical protein